MSLACAKCGKNTWTCGCFLVHELLNSQPSAEKDTLKLHDDDYREFVKDGAE